MIAPETLFRSVVTGPDMDTVVRMRRDHLEGELVARSENEDGAVRKPQFDPGECRRERPLFAPNRDSGRGPAAG